MAITGVYSKTQMNFAPGTRNLSIRVRRSHPFGPASFTVYQTGNPAAVLGAGACPALTAHPNYIEVFIRADTAFTVQSVDGDLEVQTPANY